MKKKFKSGSLYIHLFLLKSVWQKIKLFFGIVFGAFYIAWNMLFAFLYSDVLLFSVSLFYAFLALMRYILLRSSRETKMAEKSTRVPFIVGFLLLPTVLSMAAVMIYTLTRGTRKSYSPLTVIPQLVFSAYCLIGALIRISLHEVDDDTEVLCIDVISLAAAFFSVFNLVNYLSHTGKVFSDVYSVLIVGLFAVASVFAASVFLIIKARKNRKIR